MSERICPADGCDAVTAAGKFMCRRHWFGLPRLLRDEVWRTYRIILGHRRSGKSPEEKLADIRAYRTACAEAEAWWK